MITALLGGALLPPATVLAQAAQPSAPAEMVLTNARIYTLNDEEPWVEAVAIRDGGLHRRGTIR